MTGGGEDDREGCKYCPRTDTFNEAVDVMCEPCYNAFLSGMEKGRAVTAGLSEAMLVHEYDGVRGRQEIQEKIEEFQEEIDALPSDKIGRLPRPAPTLKNRIKTLEWVLGEVDDL